LHIIYKRSIVPETRFIPDKTNAMKSVTLHNSTFYNGDCISGAHAYIPDNSVDLIITDPPYGINGDTLHKHYNRDEAFVVGGYVEIPEREYGDFSIRWGKKLNGC
jgi:site-specific DNA-methyltransferase (adenine-specific)